MKPELIKRCTRCEQFLPLSKMGSQVRNGKVSYYCVCKSCNAKAKRKKRLKNTLLLEKSSTSICVFEKLLQKTPIAKFLAEAA